MIEGKVRITKETIIGEAIRIFPAAEVIIEKHFGAGCFSCPGIKSETIAFGAAMHGLDPDLVVKEINDLV